jgi:SAM-dependent methyltransferase/GNAT superfamily N-acetyltransferase
MDSLEEYIFEWHPGSLFINDRALSEFSELFSNHYGKWSKTNSKAGQNVRMSPTALKRYFSAEGSHVATARLAGKLVAYAVLVQIKLDSSKSISWISQFVTHADHRNRGIGSHLLFSLWSLTDQYCWGLVTANPYAVRALESATRRRCNAEMIKKRKNQIINAGKGSIPYIFEGIEWSQKSEIVSVNTNFDVDHSGLTKMMHDVTAKGVKWELGSMLQAKHEWFAFTFQDQEPVLYSLDEIKELIRNSDRLVREAYSRMKLGATSQAWAKHTPYEIDSILKWTSVDTGSSYILDMGCGVGRHSIELAKRGYKVIGIDYIDSFLASAREQAEKLSLKSVEFRREDCRTYRVQNECRLVLCLYDVIGSFVDDDSNLNILKRAFEALSPGGFAIFSVMNYDFTEKVAINKFQLSKSPQEISKIASSSIMQNTGNIFNPEFFLLDTETRVVYRKERFDSGSQLPRELIIRDRRFKKQEIVEMCRKIGFKVPICRIVRAGDWETSLGLDEAKAILVICQKPSDETSL